MFACLRYILPAIGRPAHCKELVAYDYLHLIVLKNLPVSIVADPEYRRFHRYNEIMSTQTFKEIVFKVVDIVDGRLGEEMKKAGRGSILHDGWTCTGVHYIAIFACYTLTGEVKQETKQLLPGERDFGNQDSVKLLLEMVSPMCRTEAVQNKKEELDVLMKLRLISAPKPMRSIFGTYFGSMVWTWNNGQFARQLTTAV